MDWLSDYGVILAVAAAVLGAAIAILRVLKPGSVWLSVLIYLMGVIEDLSPAIRKDVKEAVKGKMHLLPLKQQVALDDAVSMVDNKKTTSEAMKKEIKKIG